MTVDDVGSVRGGADAAPEPGGLHHRDLAAKSRPPQPFGLLRERLLEQGGDSVRLVLAPAGHGKTTLLAQIAARFGGPVAWYRADAADRDPAVFTAGLTRVVAAAAGLPTVPPDLIRLAEDLADLSSPPGQAGVRRLLVVDDVHEIAGSAAERDLGRFVGYVPRGLAVLLAARRVKGVDVEALRISRALDVVEADDLRFRSWEVERLFRDVYQEPLSPEDAAALSLRTEGWAAGLAMFHLATSGQPPVRRRHALAQLSRGSRLVRTYLVREVLDELPGDLRSFLRRTSSLGVLTGPLCDALLHTQDAAATLEELERRRLFIHADRTGERYRYHQVLADHLELELTEELGPRQARAWYQHTAQVLLDAGEARAAFRALARAEDWPGVERLLRDRGAQLVSGVLPHTPLPDGLDQHDPWLRLAAARRLRGRGALREAVGTFRAAAELAEDPDLVAACRAEARAAAAWLPEAEQPGRDPFGLLRLATLSHPWQQLTPLEARSDPDAVLAAGMVAALGGDPGRAERLLVTACAHPRATAATIALATCGRAAVRLVCGGAPLPESQLEDILQEAEVAAPWLARIARALLAAGREESATLSLLRIGADVEGDLWGVGLVALVQALASGHQQDYRAACTALAAVGAPVVELWARCLAAAAAGRDPAAVPELAHDARLLGARDVPAAAARRAAGSRRADEPEPPGQPVRPATVGVVADGSAGPPVRVGLLGSFSITVGDVPVDLSRVRPRSRATLHLLAMHAQRWLHRDVIAAAMWPDAAADPALHSLQVAISSLRSAIAGVTGGHPVLPARQGESYGLVLPAGVGSDVLDFERELAVARRARAGGDPDGEQRALVRALDGYRGELLPEDGPAEWVLPERDRLRLAAADAAQALAVSRAARDPGAAVDDVRRCLRIDPYRDPAWKLLVHLLEATGDAAAAQAARAQRSRVLDELGLSALSPGA